MARRSLQLMALRAFEAAARCGSFTRAARELHVTHGAISHQVKILEERLGRRLFERLNRGVRLTETGEADARKIINELFAGREKLGK